MGLNVFNTLSRSVEPFVPLDPDGKKVGLYCCGPTVHDYAHIGNFRTFLFFDLVHRYLEWSGYDVTFVMNLTDVDDKVIEAADAAGRSITEHTEPFGEVFLSDCGTLGVRTVDSYPRATAYIERMVDFIERLIENVAYQNTSDTPAAARTASFSVTDGDGGTSPAQTIVINVTAENDAPTLADLTTATFTESAVNLEKLIGTFVHDTDLGD